MTIKTDTEKQKMWPSTLSDDEFARRYEEIMNRGKDIARGGGHWDIAGVVGTLTARIVFLEHRLERMKMGRVRAGALRRKLLAKRRKSK